MIAGLSILSACSKTDSDGVADEIVPPEAVEEVKPTNPVEAQQWCRVEDWDAFQVVMRAVASQGRMQIQYLRITPNAPTVHPIGESFPYEIRTPLSVIEKKKWTVTYRKDVNEIKALYGYDKQKEIVETKLAKIPQLSRDQSAFAPDKAITVLTRSLSDDDEVIRQFYPCEQYSSYFSLNGPTRPAVEMALYLAWFNDGFVENPRESQLAKSMQLSLPIEEVTLEPAQLDRTQWCSWHQIGAGNLLLRTLTFSGDRYASNMHTQYFSEMGDEAAIQAHLDTNAKHTVFFSMNRPNGRIFGRKLGATDRPEYYAQELFASVRDARGTTALVRLNDKDPDDTWPAFIDIYYDCKDSRPLTFSPAFGSRMQTILDLQFRQLDAPAPAPAPATTPETEGSEEPAPAPGIQPPAGDQPPAESGDEPAFGA